MAQVFRIWLGVLLCLVAISSLAQPQWLYQLSDSTGMATLEHWINHADVHADSLEPALARLEHSYQQQKKPNLQRLTWLAAGINRVAQTTNRAEQERRYLKLEKDLHKKGWLGTEGELWVLLGSFYAGNHQFGKAFEYSLRGYYRLQEHGFKQNPYSYRLLGNIADIYYKLGDWQSALSYLTTLDSVSQLYPLNLPPYHVKNTIGLAYRNLQMYDSATHFFASAHQSAKAVADSFWMALSLGNLGFTHYLNGHLALAKPLLLTDFRLSLKHQQMESATNAGLILAEIYLHENKPDSAGYVLNLIKPSVLSMRSPRQMRGWFQNQFTLASRQGRQQAALVFADSALHYRDVTATNANAQLIANTRSKVEAEEYLHQIKLLDNKRQQAVLLRNALLVGLVLLAIISLLMINRAQTRQQFALEKANLQQMQAQEKMNLLKAQLEQYTLGIKDKARLLEQFELEITQLKQQQQQNLIEQEHTFGQLLKASILTEEEWQQFRELFEKVHPGFLARIRQQFTDLTPAETRMMVLGKLKLTNKEMMAMLGIGYDAIKKARQRLRKKLQLDEHTNLEEWIETL